MQKFKKVWILRPFMVLAVALSALLLLIAYFYHWVLFVCLFPLVLGALIYMFYRYFRLHREIYRLLKNMGQHLNVTHRQGMFNLPMPAAVVTQRREVIWYNDAFRKVLSEEDLYGSYLNRITFRSLEELKHHQGDVISYKDKHYKVYIVSSDSETEALHLLYFIDVTELYDTMRKYQMTRPVVMVILLDSYEEIVKNARESEKTQILSEVNRLLEQYIGKTTGFIIRLERDRYMAIIERQHFDKMLQDRFTILDETKNILTTERVPITLSIGIGYQADTFAENEQDARQALEMALGRGGDQVALMIEGGFKFYGGVSKGVEKRTKVKSRIVASAMSELILNSDQVLIMGHKFADLDAVGSAIGMARACQCLGKEVHIVLDYHKCLADTLVDHYRKFEQDERLFIPPHEAMSLARRGTLLIIVDTHSPHFVESAEVYQACKNVVVIDHHRKMVDYIDNAVIFYHEPYASSASEMVTELVQYLGNECVLAHYHAEALLSGIMLDTKNFIMKTGVRTFEAAAYLKKMGADTVEVRKLFASSMDSYQNKTKLVASAEVYNGCAIACSDLLTDDIRVVAAQAADDLLGINGVDASFVMYEQGDTVNVSARSMGAMNVQVIMETLGGGGHLTMAAAQIADSDMPKVKQLLLNAIDDYNTTHKKVSPNT
ncbi:putative bifunctional signaling protein/50S ribosomal protein L9 [uncultured Ruminococcus sp.]|uniref:Cyclic-di-AMP phosphodiesterase n=1 Tax=Massiliimalia timonensis TaxID=1987501 RepID=A0A8J6PI27_9FIRM|nr:DHH family phosphoesterase [Massiliimalia timonensis]MBC8610460.1 DHH family phosphoesterase [Massiliimalia timonensis]SCH44914.1 putative bifunctional signaling protein/50S ribosomal protein L9 [uncultured Ruminococcus sp.]SCI13191.1 putative bifunctional signaling protein/50S ribosomal protein L9 [uncultured Clostridium sp.]